MIARPAPEKAEIQRLIARAFTPQCCRHFLLAVKDPQAARDFIGGLVAGGLITRASIEREEFDQVIKTGGCQVNVGFTFRGLQALELEKGYLSVFREKAKAFVEGPGPRAASSLADTGANAPQHWEGRFKPDRAHVLLCTYADQEAELDRFAAKLDAGDGAAGFTLSGEPLRGHRLRDQSRGGASVEHFGFRDGISNPGIRGIHDSNQAPAQSPTEQPKRRSKQALHAPGEFLLGYWNDQGSNPWLLINPEQQPNPWLLPLNTAPKLAEFFRNGSFAALRKMRQDVKGFNASIERWATQLERGANVPKWSEYVRAKLGGRWSNGAVVQPDETVSPPQAPEDLNEFDFNEDPDGRGCPFGAHIRRMNPRSDKVVPVGKRPLIRRGMPYGPQDSDSERGLLGLFFCASLEDQFEHLLAEWGNANPMGPPNRGNAKDPLVGGDQSPLAFFDIPTKDGGPQRLAGFERHVTTRGTLYAFFPSLTAIGRIANRGLPKS
jgi:deferrochelatase/peroxidase EfeB